MTRIELNPDFETMQETKPQYNQLQSYKILFRQFPVFTVLPNLKKTNISHLPALCFKNYPP